MIADAPDPALERLLGFLHAARGFDFVAYKRPSIERRLHRRMTALGIGDYVAYEDYLEANPAEFAALFDALLINVTEFFRDPSTWDSLATEGIPALMAAKPDDEEIRVWSAGCASGQEAYTLAMVLAEALGPEDFRRRVKVYATDLDEGALDEARGATYSEKEVAGLSETLRSRYLEPADRGYTIVPGLRRAVVFGRNDLLKDAPISRLDLLVCRNTLMYFNVEAQTRVLRNFHFALRPAGLLVLGRSETMLSQRELFEPVELSKRFFRKRSRVGARGDSSGFAGPAARPDAPETADEHVASRDLTLDLSSQPVLVVSAAGRLEYANVVARTTFGVREADVGRPLTELAPFELPSGLPAVIAQAAREHGRVPAGRLRLPTAGGTPTTFDVTASSLPGGGEAPSVVVVLEDATRVVQLEEELDANRRDLELAYEELQSTIDELETTNEELQSSNEELQTTNEELQASNEELETMNEELHTTNEELERINAEMRSRTFELDRTNTFLEGLLSSLGLGVAVVDVQHRIQLWNDRAEELWGLRRDEAFEQPLLGLDIGLPVEALAPAVRDALAGRVEDAHARLRAINRRGRTIVVDTTIRPLVGPDGDGTAVRGAILLMRDHPSHPRDGDGEGDGEANGDPRRPGALVD